MIRTIGVAIFCGALCACGPTRTYQLLNEDFADGSSDEDADSDGDTGSDGDADGDADMDGDSDADGDTDSAFLCDGRVVGGYCWYVGAPGEACDEVCLDHGGYDAEGTTDFAGSEGTPQNCRTICTAFEMPIGALTSGSGTLGLGCTERQSDYSCHWEIYPETNGWAGDSNFARFCACNR